MSLSLVLLALACGRGGPPEGHVPAVLNDPDTGTTTTTTTTTGPTGTAGLSGEATVAEVGGEWTYRGTETAWFTAADGSTPCQVDSEVTSIPLEVPACESCEWSFSLESSGSTVQGCAGLDPSAYDGETYHYAYAQGDGYGILAVYYESYGWYGVGGSATFDPATGRFEYEWPIGSFSY